MFNVHIIKSETDEIPEDSLCYIIDGGGLFIKKDTPLMNTLIKTDIIAGLPKVIEEYGYMNIPKIDSATFIKTVSLGRKVLKLLKSEATALLFYNRDTEEFNIGIPPQEVSGGSSHYKNADVKTPAGFSRIGTVHSHPTFAASHSMVDTADEENFPGLHITIGDLDKDAISIVASVVDRGRRFEKEPADVIEGIRKVDVSKTVRDPVPKAIRDFLERVGKIDKYKFVQSYMNKTLPKPILPIANAKPKEMYEIIDEVPEKMFTTKFINSLFKKEVYTYNSNRGKWYNSYFDSNNPGSIHFPSAYVSPKTVPLLPYSIPVETSPWWEDDEEEGLNATFFVNGD